MLGSGAMTNSIEDITRQADLVMLVGSNPEEAHPVIGMQLPGPGTIYMGQTLKFLSPVRIGDTVTASVKVLSIDEVKHRAVLETTCVNQDGALLITGEAKVLLP